MYLPHNHISCCLDLILRPQHLYTHSRQPLQSHHATSAFPSHQYHPGQSSTSTAQHNPYQAAGVAQRQSQQDPASHSLGMPVDVQSQAVYNPQSHIANDHRQMPQYDSHLQTGSIQSYLASRSSGVPPDPRHYSVYDNHQSYPYSSHLPSVSLPLHSVSHSIEVPLITQHYPAHDTRLAQEYDPQLPAASMNDSGEPVVTSQQGPSASLSQTDVSQGLLSQCVQDLASLTHELATAVPECHFSSTLLKMIFSLKEE